MAKRSRKRARLRLFEGLHVDAFGDRIDLSRQPRMDEIPTGARRLCEVGYSELGGLCPLCTGMLTQTPAGHLGSAEHVPPYTLGGVVRTRTCVECNGNGARAEAELCRWWSQAYPARFATPGLQGFRTGGDALLRTATNGKFALVVSGAAAHGVHDALTTAGLIGDVTATLSVPRDAWMVALLRSSYLAACVHLGEVPFTRDARYAREVIRAGAFRTEMPMVGDGSDSVPFRVFRIYGAADEEARSLWVGVATLPWAGGGVPIFGVGLGAVAFVTWPIPDLRQRAIELATGSAA